MSDENTLARILTSGMNCFLKYTFKSAPLRRIVAEAGVTTGAFYGYFANKAELFHALTDDAAKGFMALLDSVSEDMGSFPAEDKLFSMCNAYIGRIPEIVDYILAHRNEMRLIVSCSQGTEYEEFIDNLQKRNEIIISESAAEARSPAFDISPLHTDTMKFLMDGYFHIIAELITKGESRESIVRCMTEAAKVYEVGILQLMKEGGIK